MAIRNGIEQDFEQLTSLFSSFFQTHNIFQQEKEKVMAYLGEKSQKDELIIYEEGGLIKGALFLVNLDTNECGTHKRWKFRHFAFESANIAGQLLGEAEKRVREASKTAKIELTIAETEEGIEFYKEHGYLREAVLKNHYRWEESCFVFGKSFG